MFFAFWTPVFSFAHFDPIFYIPQLCYKEIWGVDKGSNVKDIFTTRREKANNANKGVANDLENLGKKLQLQIEEQISFSNRGGNIKFICVNLVRVLCTPNDYVVVTLTRILR